MEVLTFLEARRGKEKVDLLGDMFTEFFLKKESHRRDGEDLSDYEPRFRQLVRRLEKAVKETGSNAQIPPELYGWFLLNVYMKLDASDTANVRGRAESYKLEDVFSALKKMWSGGGLSIRDTERKRRKEGHAFLQEESDPTNESQVFHQDVGQIDEEDEEEFHEIEEATIWFQEALDAILEEPTDGTVLANFKEARRALDQARTSRGFFPIKNPNAKDNRQNRFPSGPRRDGRVNPNGQSDVYCFRCGKKGHKARFCPQRPGGRSSGGTGNDKIGFVGVCTSSEEDSFGETGQIFSMGTNELLGQAIVDSGASDNIIGAETLQDLAEQLESMGFSVDTDVVVDRNHKKRFTFGNNASDMALGKAYITTGLFGHEVEIEAFVVEGPTPFLLSSRFLAEMNARIEFRSGVAVFQKLSNVQYRLQRSPGSHLLIPVTAFAGHPEVFEPLRVPDPDAAVSNTPCTESPDALRKVNQNKDEC